MQQSDFIFNRLGRIGDDDTDMTQRTLQNGRYSNLVLTNYFRQNVSNDQIDFVTSYPSLSYTGVMGPGIAGSVIDQESHLLYGPEQERPLDKLQLFQRPFLTVPYLGRGSCDPNIESQLLQGETVSGKKSVSTVVEKNLSRLPTNELSSRQVYVEEMALGGWSRGGADTRTTGDNYNAK
jgi:hypothetical protein